MGSQTSIQTIDESAIALSDNDLTAQPSPVMNLLERVLLSPELPIERVTAIMDMQERQMNKVAEQQFNAAFASAMADMPSAKKSGFNKHTKQKYSTLDDLVSASRPVLSEHGLALNWRTDTQDGWMSVTAIVRHKGGWREENSKSAPLEAGKGTGAAMNVIQAHGSTETYLKRYTGFGILGMSSEDFDDDGHSASHRNERPQFDARAEAARIAGRIERANTLDDLAYLWGDEADTIKRIKAEMPNEFSGLEAAKDTAKAKLSRSATSVADDLMDEIPY